MNFKIISFLINSTTPFQKVYERTQKIYIEYQMFMGVSDMPQYKLTYLRHKSIERAEENFEEDMYFLKITNGAYNSPNLSGILFHEFTHIYDDEMLQKKYCLSNSIHNKSKKWVYKEVHAEQIKTLYMLGCNTRDDVPETIYNKIVHGIHNKKMTFYEYCIAFKNEISSRTEIIKKAQTLRWKIYSLEDCNQFINYILYYIGIASIYKKYCDYEIESIMDISYITDVFGKGINRLFEIYCDNDINNISKGLIVESGNIRFSLIKYMIEELKIVRYRIA